MPGRALFVAIPLLGHINPLLAQAGELRRRGWRVHLASTDEVRQAVHGLEPEIEFVSLGDDPNGPDALPDLQTRVAARADVVSGTVDIMRWVNTLWPVMFDGLVAWMRTSPDIVVVDLVTTAGMDAAERVGVPYVVNNADLLTTIPFRSCHRARRAAVVPADRSRRWARCSGSQSAAADHRCNHGRADPRATAQRVPSHQGLAPTQLTRRVANTLVANSAFGLEYSRPLPPLLQMVGPMLDFDAPLPALPEELVHWLADGPQSSRQSRDLREGPALRSPSASPTASIQRLAL